MTSLHEMDHVILELRTDPESREKSKAIRARMEALTADINMADPI